MVCRRPLARREIEIIQHMKKVSKVPVKKIADFVDRNKTTVYRALRIKLSKDLPKRGISALLTKAKVNHIVKVLRAMVKKADAKREITMAMLKKRAKVQCCQRTIRRALAKKNIKFRKMRTKPLLTKTDRRLRMAFARKYEDMPASWWLQVIDMHEDEKNWPAYVTARGRDYAAMREVRGVYRAPGQGLDEAYVVAPKELRFNPGCKSVKIAGGVGKNGKVLLWHDYGRRWSGKVAAAMYKGPMLAALKRSFPRRRRFTLLEDNDPTGHQSKAGVAAKRQSGITVFRIPPRSPDLSVMDYAVWKPISRKMRAQERKMPKGKKETRGEYANRLARAARSLKPDFVKKAIKSMKRRCQLLYKAKGGHFEEGGLH